MSKLEVECAELNYEVAGEGPLLVVIPGAQGSLMVYRGLSEHLKSRFKVLSYDRRGFGQSALGGEQDYSRRLDTDADDVAALIAHVGGPAIVFGSSSGAIVSLRVLTRHPEAVRLLVAHEPPLCRWLADPDAAIAENYAVYEKAKTQGGPAAMQDFALRWLAPSDREMLAQAARNPAVAPQMQANMAYWFEHELRQYPATDFDLDAIRAQAGRLELVAGEEMRGFPTFEITEALAGKLAKTVTVLPGGHIGYATKPESFAEALAELLNSKGGARDALS